MIRINLLPEKETQRRRTPRRVASANQVSPLTILIIIVATAAAGGYYYQYIRKPVIDARTKRDDAQKVVTDRSFEIEKLRARVDNLQKQEALNQSRLEILDALDSEDRLLWAQKLNQLCDLKPDNIFITRISVTEKITQKETPASVRARAEAESRVKAAAKGKKVKRGGAPGIDIPPQVFYPEIKQFLTVTAIAASESEPERVRLISEFYSNLTTGENAKSKLKTEFMKGFTGEIGTGGFTQKMVGLRAVSEFTFTIETVPTSPKKMEEKKNV